MVKDHLGNEYNSISEMYKAWNIPKKLYYKRKSEGWCLQKILETPIRNNNHLCRDHLNNEFNSITAMCRYWNISKLTFDCRIKSGWTLKDALEIPVSSSNNSKFCKSTKDHTGKEFTSFVKMCNYWNKDDGLVQSRLRGGWTLKDALEKEVRQTKDSTDHNKHKFFTVEDMTKHWNIRADLYRGRIRLGWSTEYALTYQQSYTEPISKIDTSIRRCIMTNQELFDLTHSVSINEKGKKVWTCKLCGKVVKKINEANLEETIARTNPELYWCNNSTEEDGTCVGRLSSIAYDENPDMCVPKMIYNHKKRKSGTAVYKFECKKCGLVAPMTFEQVVEHKMEHINNKE